MSESLLTNGNVALAIIRISALVLLMTVCVLALLYELSDSSFWKITLSTCVGNLLAKGKIKKSSK